jgi:hypothetical protein
MTTRIKLRRDTAANWAEANPILAAGEPGLELDTGKVKYGNGTSTWTSLDYSGAGDKLTDDHKVTVTVGNTEYWAIVNRVNNDGDGVEASAVAYDSEGNMIALHVADGLASEGREVVIISKFDTAANLLWQKQINNEADGSIAHDVCVDSNDNIFVALTSDDTLVPQGTEGIDSIVIVKLDSDGAVIWQKDYQGNASVAVSDPNVFIFSNTVATTTFNGNAAQSIQIINNNPWNATGLVFSRTENGTSFTTIGTVLGQTLTSQDDNPPIAVLYFAAGTFTDDLDPTTYDYRLAGSAPNSFQEIGAMVCDGTDIYFTGEYNEDSDGGGGSGQDKGLIAKVSGATGALVWSKVVNYGNITTGMFYGMDIGADGNIVTVGVVEVMGAEDAVISKFSGVDGSHIWSKLIPSSENTAYTSGDVVIDSQNNVFVSINSRQEIVHNTNDQLLRTITHIMKLNSSGVQQWTRRVGPGPCASVATGIDCDATGNVYLSALTVAQDNPTRETDDYFNTARNVLVVAKYSTSGTVLWQRYIEAEGYEFIASHVEFNDEDGAAGNGSYPGEYYHSHNRGRYVSLNNSGKLAVQVSVKARDFDNYVWSTRYTESITFQIDQDGREMTIGNGNERFTVKASRVPGKMVTLNLESLTGGDAPTVTNLASNLLVTNTTFTVTEGELAQQIAKSAPYEYVFGNDGTLTIPNDGDVKLVQTQIGWFSIFGSAEDNSDDVWIRASCVDTATGDVYVVGQDDDNNQGFVGRYNSQGQLLWSIRLYDNDDGVDTRCNAVKIHPTRGNVIVLCEYYGNETAAMVVEIDPDTARVLDTLGFRDQNANNAVQAYDFDFFSNGDIAVVGRKYDEFTTIPVVAQTGSGLGTLVILNSATSSSAAHPVDTNWSVSGTGITGRASIQYVNRYTGLTGDTRPGSGAMFEVLNTGGGNYIVTSATGGTNYRTGHKVKILGTALGGATPDNDLILTVTAVNGEVIGTGDQEGVAAGTNAQTYYELTGTSYNIGSGATIDVIVNDAGLITINNISAGGTNYVEGDWIVIPGTVFAGGTAPTNNLYAVVATVDGAPGITGPVTAFNSEVSSGTAPTTHRKIEISDVVDFDSEGTWTVGYPLGGEAFVLRYATAGTITWSKVLSGGGQGDNDERYFSVVVDSDNAVYAAGEMFSRGNATVGDLVSYKCAVVTKFNSSGVPQWTKALNDDLFDCSAKCVAVQGTTVAVSHHTQNNDDTVITKLDTAGNIKWQRRTDSGDDSSVAIDTNGDIYAVVEGYFETRYEDIIKVIKFAANGEISYRKFIGTLTNEYSSTHEYFKNGRNLTLDADHMYISGYTTAPNNDYESGFIVKLPKTGDCDGSYGIWAYQTEEYDVDKVTETEATTFTPNVGTGNWETWIPDFRSEWYDPSDDNYYHMMEEIRDRDGGAIEFADGTRQTSSAQQIPQRKISTGADHRLCLEDMGKHIYVINRAMRINVPYHEDAPLPMGFSVVIVNNSNSMVSIDGDGGNINIVVPGVATSSYWDLSSPGMATLIKVEENRWFMTGNVSDDS